MPVYKRGQSVATFTPEHPVERHFHDCDETWVIIEGTAQARLTTPSGKVDEFVLEAGDIWMIYAGEDHEAMPLTPVFKLVGISGTLPPDARETHLYKEHEGYVPSLQLVKTPIR